MMKRKLNKLFGKIDLLKTRASRWIDDNLPTQGSIVFLVSFVSIYSFSNWYISRQDVADDFFSNLGFDVKPYLPLAIILTLLYFVNIFAVYGSAISLRNPKGRHFFGPLIGLLFIDYYIFNHVLMFDKNYIHILPFFISFFFISFVSLVYRDDFGLKIKFNQKWRGLLSIGKKKEIKILHSATYKYSQKVNDEIKQYEINLEWSLERKITDDAFLDSIVDYDNEGKQFSHKLVKQSYDLLENCLILRTLDKTEIEIVESSEVTEHLKFMKNRGWCLPHKDYMKMLFLSTSLMEFIRKDEKYSQMFDEFLDNHFKVSTIHT